MFNFVFVDIILKKNSNVYNVRFYLTQIGKSSNKLPNVLQQENSAVKWSNCCVLLLQIISAAGTYTTSDFDLAPGKCNKS